MASPLPLAAFTPKNAYSGSSSPGPPLLTSQALVYKEFRRKTLLSSSDAMIAFRGRKEKKACLACVQNSEECIELESGAGYRCTLCAERRSLCSWKADVLIPATAEYFGISLEESVDLYEQWEDTIKVSDNVDGNVGVEQDMEIVIHYETPPTPVSRKMTPPSRKVDEKRLPKRVPKPTDKARAMTEISSLKKSKKRKRKAQEEDSSSSKKSKSSPGKVRLLLPPTRLSTSPTKANKSPVSITPSPPPPPPTEAQEPSTSLVSQPDRVVQTTSLSPAPPPQIPSPPQHQIPDDSDSGSLSERYTLLQERYLKLCDVFSRSAIEAKLKDDTIQRLREESVERERASRQDKADMAAVVTKLREEKEELERKLQSAQEQSAAVEKWLTEENGELDRRLKEAMERPPPPPPAPPPTFVAQSPGSLNHAHGPPASLSPPAQAPTPSPSVVQGMQYGAPYGTIAYYANLERERRLREAAHNLAVSQGSQGSAPMVQPDFNSYGVPYDGSSGGM
ncbi:hypothetical protein GALMADRAFT_239124, partial [Galerina marginata CBS 339.88]